MSDSQNLGIGFRQKREKKKQQATLREKHGISDESIVVIEKSGAYKATLRLFISAVKLIATVLLITFSAIGILSLIYPAPRADMIRVLLNIWHELTLLLGIS
jgi:DNA-binding XRE family transcriptional regulator